MPTKLGILISDNESIVSGLIAQIKNGVLNASIELVVASTPEAPGLKDAEEAGIQTLTLSKEIYGNVLMADEIIAAELVRHKVDYVLLAGYDRSIYDPLFATFPQRIVDVHPSLLPSFPGPDAIHDAFDSGAKVTGVTAYFLGNSHEKGGVIAQRPIVIEEGWTLENLAQNVEAATQELFLEVVQLLCAGRVQVQDDGHVRIDPKN